MIMNQVFRKMRSRNGASMIIALIFLLFCVFVGGSVLASASANGARAARQAQQQQDFLGQRSAVLLLADQLLFDRNFQLIVKDVTTVSVLGRGPQEGWTELTGDDRQIEESQFVTFEVRSAMNPLQQILVEATILRYLEQNEYPSFQFRDNTGNIKTAISQFSCYSPGAPDYIGGSISFDGTSDAGSFVSTTASFSSGKGTNLYDFSVSFQDNAQLSLNMPSAVGDSQYELPEQYQEVSGSQRMWKVTDTVTYTVITWGAPQIEKEGAA